MEAISITLALATVILLILAILGLIKPSWIKQSSRGKAFGIFAGASFVCFMIVGLIASKEAKESSQETPVAQEPEKASESLPPEPAKSPVASTVEEPQKPKNPQLNFDAVVDSLKNEFKVKVEYNFGDKFCSQPNYCQAFADGILVTGMGHIVDAATSIKASPKTYQTVCAAILSGLSGANKEIVWSMNKQAFDFAAQNGRAETKLGNVDIKITADSSNNLLKCSYVRIIR